MILSFFKPINIKEQEYTEIPLLKLEKFKISELNNKGLLSILKGSVGLRYSDRYSIQNIDYTDNEDKFLTNIKSRNGIYKDDNIKLEKDVVYSRADGFSFKTQKANYNQSTKVVNSPTDFVSIKDKHKVIGSSIIYDSVSETTKAKNVIINYKLKER
jgi:hypothetical protein